MYHIGKVIQDKIVLVKAFYINQQKNCIIQNRQVYEKYLFIDQVLFPLSVLIYRNQIPSNYILCAFWKSIRSGGNIGTNSFLCNFLQKFVAIAFLHKFQC